MSDDYLERTQNLAQLRGLGELNDSDYVGNFALYGRERRIEILQAIDKDLTEPSDDLRKTTDSWRTRQRLGEAHDALLKADR